MRRPPDRTTKTLPCAVDASSWVTSPSERSAVTRARSSAPARASACEEASSASVEPWTAPLSSSLSLFSPLESAFNIVYGRPNRSFLHGKGIAAVVMVATIATLFASLVVGALGVEVLKRYAPGFVANSVVAYIVSIAVSLLGVFVFVLAAYRLLTNAEVTVRGVLPGALMAAVVLEASFQIVPVFVRLADVNPTLRVL